MRLTRLLAIALFFAPALSSQEPVRGIGAAAQERASLQGARYHALLIGVQNYPDPQLPSLQHPIADAERLGEVLRRRYQFDAVDIAVLRDPSRKEILDALSSLASRLGGNDNLLIFFAGHGHWDGGFQQGYWFPVDATRGSRGNWITNSDVRDAIRGIKARHVLLISDACFSGGILQTRAVGDATVPGIARLYELPSRKAMTSGAQETVPDRSAFLDYLVKRLEENSAPLLPSSDLFASLRTAVINNSPVTPQYGTIHQAGDEGGDFLFRIRTERVLWSNEDQRLTLNPLRLAPTSNLVCDTRYDGAAYVLVNRHEGLCVSPYFGPFPANVRLEFNTTLLRATQTQGCVAQMLLGDNEMLTIFLNPAGGYSITRGVNGVWTGDWKSSDSIRRGVGAANRVAIEMAGSRVSLTVNGTHLDDVTYGFPITGHYRLCAFPGSDLAFTDIRVIEIGR